MLGGPGVPEAPIARGSATQAEREVGGRWYPGGGMELDVGGWLRVPLNPAKRLPPCGAKTPILINPIAAPALLASLAWPNSLGKRRLLTL